MAQSDPRAMNIERLEKIVEFNLYPVRYIHSSWLEALEFAQIVDALKGHEQSHFYLSGYLLNSLNIDDSFDSTFDTADKIIALGSSEELGKLVLYMGIVQNEAVIRNVIRGDQREKLEACLGDEAYFFAVKKAQFLAKKNDTASPEFLIDWQQVGRFKSYLIVSGLKVLATVYEGLSQGFIQRLSLKFPRSWSKHLERLDSNGLSKQQGINLLIKSYKEVNKQWQHQLS
ncbi:SctK family type III secretion system sorting platform protein [Candidatus Sororendozoicomonas aggregata]|uniref:SctK family type III secretion system sorting platform protein n=1 Tax=Candidatus Sororendozoicomonas aggregata TaxID=3073239 RepID=UPI002ED68331